MRTKLVWACVAIVSCVSICRVLAQEPATLPGARNASAEQNKYDERFREKFGDLPSSHAAEFMEEIRAGNDYTLDRDSRVLHLKKALALRPNDPANIAIEFCMTIELSQHTDPKHHEGVRRKDGQEVAEHLIATYDSKSTYRDSPGWTFASPDYMVPQTAVWASEYDSVFVHRRADAQKYVDLAMDDFYWAFQKRRAAWASAPRPATKPARAPDGFTGDDLPRGRGQGDYALHAWEQRKADAAAGNVMGYNAKPFSQAAVHAYVLAYAIKPSDEAKALKQVIAKYPASPMAAIASERLAKLPVADVAAASSPLSPLARTPLPPPPAPLAATPPVVPPAGRIPIWLGIIFIGAGVAAALAAILIVVRWTRMPSHPQSRP